MTCSPDLLWFFSLQEPRHRPRVLRVTDKGYRRGLKPANAGRKFPATPPTPEEVMRLMDACPTGKIGTRNRALICLLWRSGLRISEALALLPHHIDWDACTVFVANGKGGKARVSGIDPGARQFIDPWLDIRATLELPKDAPLFCSASKPNPGQPLYSAYVRECLHELAVKAQIPKRIAPHQLRHAHACDLAREHVDLHLISRQLGHSNLGTTATYLSSIAPFEVIEAVSGRSFPKIEGGS